MAKQLSLFPTTMPQHGVRQVFLNNVERQPLFKSVCRELDAAYILDDIKLILAHIAKVLDFAQVLDKADPGREIVDFRQTIGRCFRLKKEYAACLALFLSDRENFALYFSALNEPQRKLWRLLACRHIATASAIKKATGKAMICISKQSYYYASEGYADSVMTWTKQESLDTWRHPGREEPFSYHLPDTVVNAYIRYVLREEEREAIEGEGIETLPAGTPGATYSGEEGIGGVICVVGQLESQGLLDTDGRKMSAAMIAMASEKTRLAEFLPLAPVKATRLLASAVATPALAAYCNRREVRPDKYWENVRELYKRADFTAIGPAALTHLKGVSTVLRNSRSSQQTLYAAIKTVVAALPQGRWFAMRDICVRLLVSGGDRMEMLGVDAYEIDKRHVKLTVDDKTELTSADIHEHITLPLIYGMVAFMATTGVVDVRVAPGIATASTYGFLTHLRLTPLGAYVLGKSRKYEAQGIVVHKVTEYFDVDTERLMIRAVDIDGSNPYEGILQQWGEAIGNRRYRVTPATFLKDCHDTDDIQLKINNFKANLCPAPPPVWQTFFNDMLTRCRPFQKPERQYVLKRVDPSALALQQAIKGNAYIRKHTLLVERHYLLIELAAVERVRAELRNEGFIV